jgi:putative ABC transport system substrate-binding protein
MSSRHRSLARFLLALLVTGVPWTGAVLAAPTIQVVLSEPAGIYQEAAEGLTRELKRHSGDWKVTTLTLDRYSSQGGDLTITVGTKALEAALAQPGRPVLSLLVPRLTYERLAAGKVQVSALYLDQPLPRQLQLLGLALPGLKRVGVPLGPISQAQQSTLQRAAKATGIQVGSAQIHRGQDLHAALDGLAEESQAFVLLPDPVVAQRSTLQNLFLHTYRLKKPVLAYSAPLAKSGALLALYATPEQLGEEAAAWIRESWGSEFRLGAPRHPRRFTVAVNHTVARSRSTCRARLP